MLTKLPFLCIDEMWSAMLSQPLKGCYLNNYKLNYDLVQVNVFIFNKHIVVNAIKKKFRYKGKKK